MTRTLLSLSAIFGLLSLLAVGGGNTIIPQMQHDAVEREHWMNDEQFVGCYSLSRAAPGPSMLIVTLIGYKAAGIIGAVVATLAMFLPACILTYVSGRYWDIFADSPVRQALARGLAPLTVGLMLSGVWTVGKTAITGFFTFGIAVVVTVVLLRTKINPVLVILAAGALGWIAAQIH